MIRIKFIDGQWCPVLECAVCKEEIRDHRLAMAVWDETVPVRYVHKVTCDDRSLPLSDELTEHFTNLLFNIGIRKEGE